MMKAEDLDLVDQYCAERSRDNFYEYRQYIHDFKLKTGWFVKEISEALEQFYIDYSNGKRPSLVIEAPPQHGKSEAITDFIEWMAGKKPDTKFIYASFSEYLGIRANLKIQKTMDREKYQQIFSDCVINDRNVVTTIGNQRNKQIIKFIGAEGSFRNTTVQGSVTGETLDIGVIDDPIKGREAANSGTIREKTWNWFTDDFMTRFDEMGGLLIILTRWHIDDPVGRLLKKDKSIKLLSYKAIAEQDETYRKKGEALFPEHKSIDFLTKRKNSMASASWESLYQQNPIIQGGNLFKDEWWRYYAKLPALQWRAVYADTAQKTKEQNDYTVFQCWGLSKEGQAYLIDQVRGKWEAPELLTQARAFWNKQKSLSNGTLRKFNIEDKVSGTGLIQTLKREGIPVLGLQRNIDKLTRAHDVLALIESGNVYLPSNAGYLSDYLTEFAQFPNGVFDDQVDPTMDALDDMLNNGPQWTLSGIL